MNILSQLNSVLFTFFALTQLSHAAVPGPYFGVGSGYGRMTNFSDAHKIGKQSRPTGKVFVGYNFNCFFGVEVAYTKFPGTTFEVNTNPNLTFDYNLNITSIVAKAYVPIIRNGLANIYCFAGLGAARGEADFKFSGSKLTNSSNQARIAIAGVGGSYQINSSVTTSLEYTRTGGKSGNADHVGIPTANLVTVNFSYSI